MYVPGVFTFQNVFCLLLIRYAPGHEDTWTVTLFEDYRLWRDDYWVDVRRGLYDAD